MKDTKIQQNNRQTMVWETPAPKKVYSDNDVINAYIKGRADGMIQQQIILLEKFKNNLEKAKTIAGKFYNELNEKFNCLYLKLKATDITEFEALVVIDEADFIKDNFKNAYQEARKLKKEVNETTFNLSFSFMPFSKNIDDNALLIDGYFLQYANKKKS